jgi:MFS family permease
MSRSQRLTLVATILASTVVFLDATVVNVALPAMERDLGMGLAGQQWVVEAYLLALVSLMLVGGSLGDHFGRRRTFSIGLVGFGATSILCALAPSTGTLIAFRGIQGLAGALLVPGSLAIVTATFVGEARGGLLAIAVLGAVISAQFATRLDERLAGERLEGKATAVVESSKSRPLAGRDEAERLTGPGPSSVGAAIEESSRDGFRLAVVISALLMFTGGLTSALWIRDPRRRPTVPSPTTRAAAAGECARPDGARDREPLAGARDAAPETAEAPL